MTDVPLLSLALSPKTAADGERLTHGLQILVGEQPMMRVSVDSASDEVVIAAVSEAQLESTVDRLKREFNVEATLGRPQVAYKESFTRCTQAEVRYVDRSTGASSTPMSAFG